MAKTAWKEVLKITPARLRELKKLSGQRLSDEIDEIIADPIQRNPYPFGNGSGLDDLAKPW